MTPRRSIGDRVRHALYAPSDGHGLALFRIAFGIYLLGYFGALAPHVTVLFSSHGVYVPYALPLEAPAPVVAWALYLATLAAAATLAVGYRANLAGGALLLLFGYHYFLQLAAKQSSFDRLIAIYLLILCFAGSGSVWSLDARAGRARPTTVWGERMIMFQSIALYLGAGLWKAVNPRWHGGEMLWFTMQGLFSTPASFALVRAGLPEWFWATTTIGTFVAEIALGIALMFRRARPYAIACGTVFHLANCFVLDIPEFLISVTAYAVFIEGATLQRWGARLGALLTRRAPASSS